MIDPKIDSNITCVGFSSFNLTELLRDVAEHIDCDVNIADLWNIVVERDSDGEFYIGLYIDKRDGTK